MSLNPIHDPWIPVSHEGRYRELSLLEAIRLGDKVFLALSPYEFFPVLRFLLLAVHRALERALFPDTLSLSPEDLARRVEAHLVPHTHRFELFTEDFFLSGPSPHYRPRSLADLRPDWPSGNNPLLNTPHRTLSPAEVFRSLLVHLHYHPGGIHAQGISLPGAPLAHGPVAFAALGPNLHATLLLNLVDAEVEEAPWESLPAELSTLDPSGPRRYLIPSRFYRLAPDSLHIAPGPRPGTRGLDPMLAYTREGSPLFAPKRGFLPGRIFLTWQDLAPPAVLERAEEVALTLGLSYTVVVSAQLSEQARILAFTTSFLPPLTGERLRLGAALSEIGLALEEFLKRLGEERERPLTYWARLEELLYLGEEAALKEAREEAYRVANEALGRRIRRGRGVEKAFAHLKRLERILWMPNA